MNNKDGSLPLSVIHPLPFTVGERIKASLLVPTIGTCVRELVYNSLDAGSKRIHVTLAFSPPAVVVKDDGCGIDVHSLHSIGSEGCSLLRQSHGGYGVLGRALHSIILLSEEVKVITKVKVSKTSYQKVFKKGICTGIAAVTKFAGAFNTIVSVAGLFQCIPVRLKQINSLTETQELKVFLNHLSVIHPDAVFTLETTDNSITFETGPASSALRALCREAEKSNGITLHPGSFFTIDLHSKTVAALGEASSVLTENKPVQYLFINRSPVLHPRLCLMISKAVHTQLLSRAGGRKQSYPVFYLNIQCDQSEYNLVSDSLNSDAEFKQHTEVMQVLMKVADVIADNVRSSTSSSSNVAARSQNVEPVAQERRSVSLMAHRDLQCGVPAQRAGRTGRANSSVDVVWPSSKQEKVSQHSSSSCQKFTQKQEVSESFHLPNGFVLDLRCGNSYRTPSISSTQAPASAVTLKSCHSKRSASTPKDRVSITPLSQAAKRSVVSSELPLSSTMQRTFAEWSNPTFTAQQEFVKDCRLLGNGSSETASVRFRKEMFQDIEVAGHIDNKFIAGVLKWQDKNNGSSNKLLVLIDQHAADERIRLERFIQCVSPSSSANVVRQPAKSLTRPLALQFPGVRLRECGEAVLFDIYMAERGFAVSIKKSQVLVEGLPEILVSSCQGISAPLLSRDKLETIFRDYINVWKSTEHSSVPASLLTELKSLACHGAIRFGDPLSTDRLHGLVAGLATCALPFQCAHGRPSLVPLLSLQGGGTRQKNGTL